MKQKFAAAIALLILATPGVLAQKRIKTIDITVPIPEVGNECFNEVKATSVITDAFGSVNMLGDGKIQSDYVNFIEFNTEGDREHLSPEAVYEAGREYVMTVHVTNLTDILFNYKNDKNFTVDDTVVKATINGQKAKILKGSSGRPLGCEIIIKMPGTRDPFISNTKVSAADGDHSGYGYVDLELPSGTKWATCNVGAKTPEGYGNFYSFGETTTKTRFDKGSFTGFGSFHYQNPYNLDSPASEDKFFSVKTRMGRRLKPEYDAASKNMGGEWRTPTRLQCKELRENCYAKYMKVNGISGTLYTSKKNGKSIFIPYAGSCAETTVSCRGNGAAYMTSNSRRIVKGSCETWGSSYYKDSQTGINLFNQITYMYNEDPVGSPARNGYSVRGVWGGKDMDGDKTRPEEKSSAKESNGNSADKENKGSKNKMKGLLNKGKSLLNKL